MTMYFYDTEFIDDGRTIELISIGIVADDGREYYAVNSDVDVNRIRGHAWLNENVWPHLPRRGESLNYTSMEVKFRPLIAREVRDFLLAGETPPELWAWYAAYDHVVLAQLWGPMVSMPSGIPQWTNDLRQEADRLGIFTSSLPVQAGGEHDALEDARWNRVVYDYLAQFE